MRRLSSVTPTEKIDKEWTLRVEAEFKAGNLTRAYRDVLLELAKHRGPDGVYPAHKTLADATGASVRTVQRALDQGAALDLVSWLPRYREERGRQLRTSNRYFLMTPTTPVEPGRGPVWPRSDKIAEEKEKIKKEARQQEREAWQEVQNAAARGPNLLEMRRKAIEAQQRARLEGHMRV